MSKKKVHLFVPPPLESLAKFDTLGQMLPIEFIQDTWGRGEEGGKKDPSSFIDQQEKNRKFRGS